MISIVVPAYNEEESLGPLFEEIEAVARAQHLEIETLFVDDGSTDGTWKAIHALAEKHAAVQGVRLRRNFGKAAALSAGFRAARGDLLFTMDADLQDDPREIPNFLKEIALGFDVVSGWKRIRHDPWHKVWPSRIFNWMISWLTGVTLHDHNCGMKCFRSQVFREVRLYGELHRFIPVLAQARGFKVAEIPIQHRPRRFGRSKYGVRRFAKGFLDLLTVKFLTGFGQRPSHVMGGMGLFTFLTGSAVLAYLAVTWVINAIAPGSYLPLHERPLLIYAIAALLLGAQMLSLGFLAEMITAYLGRNEDAYSIADQTRGQNSP